MSKRFNLEYFLIGVMFIWTSILAFKNPASDLIALTVVFGLMALVKGVLEIFLKSRDKTTEQKNSKLIPLVGIIDFFVGLFFLLNITIGANILPFVFAVWFLSEAIINLVTVRKTVENKYFLYVFINIVSIIFGVILLINPIVSALTLALIVGCYLLVTGISYLVLSF
jgi:uncharacterized membrane protein HdeD (DUF308 family)